LTDGVNSVSGSSTLRVEPGTSLAYTPLLADSAGTVVAERRYGKGTIIVVTDQSLFVNKRIARSDNAKLAYDLVAGTNGVVAFDEYVHGYASGLSWWTILPMPVRAAIIIVVSGVALLLIGTALRFGPTARLAENTERTSAEYLSSMAQLLARGRAARKAMRDLINVTLNEIAVTLGLSDRASVAQIERGVRGSEDGDARAAQVHELGRLRSLDAPSDADLLRAAQLCASLRKEYSRYGRIGFGRRAAPVWRSA
jgi:transcriptional regulator with XRE-family HTH domain